MNNFGWWGAISCAAYSQSDAYLKEKINLYHRKYTRKWLLKYNIKVHDFLINSIFKNIKIWFYILLIFTISLAICFGILALIFKPILWFMLGGLGVELIFALPTLIWQFSWLHKAKQWKTINAQLPNKNLFEIYVWKKWKKNADKYNLLGKTDNEDDQLVDEEYDNMDNDLELQESYYYFYYGLKQNKFLNFLPWRFQSKNMDKQMKIIYKNSLFDFENTYYSGGKIIKPHDMFWGLYSYGWYDSALKYDESNNDFVVIKDEYRL